MPLPIATPALAFAMMSLLWPVSLNSVTSVSMDMVGAPGFAIVAIANACLAKATECGTRSFYADRRLEHWEDNIHDELLMHDLAFGRSDLAMSYKHYEEATQRGAGL